MTEKEEQNTDFSETSIPKTQELSYTALYVSDPEASHDRDLLYAYQMAHPELEPFMCYMNGCQSKTGEDREASVYASGQLVFRSSDYNAFPSLMRDVSDGKVKCIIVVNLASFAMGYLDTIYYIQNVFRYQNVRFLSLEDDFDSWREEDLQRLEKKSDKMVSEAHSRKLSRARCEQAQKRAEQPDAMSPGSAPYGYFSEGAASDDRSYQPDPQTAPYVTMMFRWAQMGLSCGQIAERMVLLGEPTPGQIRSGEVADPTKWNSHVILKILRNPNYTGDMHIGRMQQALYKSEARHQTDMEDWIIRENTHVPLTTRQDYEEVQQSIMRKNKRQRPKMDA